MVVFGGRGGVASVVFCCSRVITVRSFLKPSADCFWQSPILLSFAFERSMGVIMCCSATGRGVLPVWRTASPGLPISPFAVLRGKAAENQR